MVEKKKTVLCSSSVICGMRVHHTKNTTRIAPKLFAISSSIYIAVLPRNNSSREKVARLDLFLSTLVYDGIWVFGILYIAQTE